LTGGVFYRYKVRFAGNLMVGVGGDYIK
jgi:hypothetical protein